MLELVNELKIIWLTRYEFFSTHRVFSLLLNYTLEFKSGVLLIITVSNYFIHYKN